MGRCMCRISFTSRKNVGTHQSETDKLKSYSILPNKKYKEGRGLDSGSWGDGGEQSKQIPEGVARGTRTAKKRRGLARRGGVSCGRVGGVLAREAESDELG